MMEQNDQSPNESTAAEPNQATRNARLEQQRLTRRQALRKLGFGAGMAAFMLFGVDDFARMAGQQLQQVAGDNKVANDVARELRSAGVTLADGTGSSKVCPCGNASSANGNCTQLCEMDQCDADAIACRDYPDCCDYACNPTGSPGCTAYSLQLQTNATTRKDCEANPQKYHKGCS